MLGLPMIQYKRRKVCVSGLLVLSNRNILMRKHVTNAVKVCADCRDSRRDVHQSVFIT